MEVVTPLGLEAKRRKHLDKPDRGYLPSMLFGMFAAFLTVGGVSLADPPAADIVLALQTRPAVVWPSGPLEVVAAFDRPIESAQAAAFVGRTIPYFAPSENTGTAGTLATPSGQLQVVAARLVDDGRTLLLATDPHPRVARYVLPLQATGRNSAPGPQTSSVPYDLTGVAAVWSEPDDPAESPGWTGWWPQLDPEIARRDTRGSKPHEAGLALLSRPGRLSLSALAQFPPGMVALQIETSGAIEEFLLGDSRSGDPPPDPRDRAHRATLSVDSRGDPLFLTITVRTGCTGRPFSLRVSYRVAGETASRPIERDRLMVPWAPMPPGPAIAAPLTVPDLSGGDPDRGRAIFQGDQARCSQCHAFRGQGGKAGPDLTEIGRKSRAEIYRAIAVPSAAIEPDYTSYTVATRDGQVVAGVVRAEGADSIRVVDTNARVMLVLRSQIQEIRPSATSIMPAGLAAALGDSSVRDLIAYLTSPLSTVPPPSGGNRK
jgi:putative heme-binding domain-containing protein